MPKAKYIRGYRMTRPPQSFRSRRKEDGRPRGTLKRFAFEQTRLGFFLKYEVPVVYDILRNMTPPGPFFEPPYLLVQKVCAASGDTSLRKSKFYRYLEEYKQQGLFCRRAKNLTPGREAYYRSLREKKLQRFIAANRRRIECLRLSVPWAHASF